MKIPGVFEKEPVRTGERKSQGKTLSLCGIKQYLGEKS